MILFVSGLPRSGSTVLCRVLAQHPQMGPMCATSPMAGVLNNLIESFNANESFRASPMDDTFKQRFLTKMYQATLEAWHEDEVSLDKNRGWMRQIPILKRIYPDFKMFITVRPLKDIFGSIAARNEETNMLTFPGKSSGTLSHNLMAESLFALDGVVGGPLQNLFLLINDFQFRYDLQDNLYFVTPEKLLDSDAIFRFAGLEPVQFETMSEVVVDRDAFYNHKFPHQTRARLGRMPEYQTVAWVQQFLENTFKWYHDFYKEVS